jgi:hypothetical protein
MLVLRFDVKNSDHLHWPTTEAQILALGRAYVSHEATLPLLEQLKDLPLSTIQSALHLAETAREAGSRGEADRVNAVATYQITVSKIREALRQAREVLEPHHAQDIFALRNWGFEIILSRDQPTVRLPTTNQEWILLLTKYVQQEGSLPEAKRVPQPSYGGRARVEASEQVGSHEIQRLLELLQGAALIRILSRYNSQVTPELRAWGYEVRAPEEGS